MPEHLEHNEELNKYLLGDLSEEVRQGFEERLMTESGFLDELEACEDELIDDYVNNELDAENRARFENNFLCGPERLQKLKFAMALSRYTSQSSNAIEPVPDENRSAVNPPDPTWAERIAAFWKTQSWAFRSVFTVAVFAIIALAIIPPLLRTPSSIDMTLSISASDRSEGTATSRVSLPLAAEELRITLRLPDIPTTSSGFRVELLNNKFESKPLEIKERDAQSVTVVIPADELDRGDYALRLSAIRSDGTVQRITGSYFFTAQ